MTCNNSKMIVNFNLRKKCSKQQFAKKKRLSRITICKIYKQNWTGTTICKKDRKFTNLQKGFITRINVEFALHCLLSLVSVVFCKKKVGQRTGDTQRKRSCICSQVFLVAIQPNMVHLLIIQCYLT